MRREKREGEEWGERRENKRRERKKQQEKEEKGEYEASVCTGYVRVYYIAFHSIPFPSFSKDFLQDSIT